MRRPPTRYANSGGLDIAYQVLGNGPFDLIVVPPDISVMEPSWEWPALGDFWRRLARYSRLILLDKRGTGLSDRIAGVPTLEERMDDIRAVMDAVASQRAALLGGCEAGPISALFAATYPERVIALALVGAPVKSSGAPDLPPVVGDDEEQTMLDYLENFWGTGLSGEKFAPSLAGDKRARELVGRFECMAGTPNAMRAAIAMNHQVDIRHVLSSISAPTLVIHRRGDRIVPVEHGRYYAKRIPGAKYVEFGGEDHWWWTGENTYGIAEEIAEFLTGEPYNADADRVLKTILFTDIVGSTNRAVELGDRRWHDLLDHHDTAVRHALERFRGQEVNTTGDGFLAAFDGPARAIRCAQVVAEDARELGLEIRAGLHTGECEVRADDLAGIAVHTGARVASIAGPGEVLVTSTVRDLVAGSGIEFTDRGSHSLKGVPHRWHLFSVDIA